MAIRPKCPPERYLRPSCDLCVQRCGGRSHDAALRVSAALKVRECDVLDRAVALDGPRDTLWRRGDVGVLVGLVEGESFVGDGRVVDVTVGRGCGGESEREKKGFHDGEWSGVVAGRG